MWLERGAGESFGGAGENFGKVLVLGLLESSPRLPTKEKCIIRGVELT